MDVDFFLSIGFHFLVRVLDLKKRDELTALELESSDYQGLEVLTLFTRSAHLREYVQPSGLPGSQVGINRNASLFRGHLGGYFELCTEPCRILKLLPEEEGGILFLT